MSDEIEGGIFLYVPRPEYFQNGLALGYFSCVLFATGWERGGVQAAKRMSAKQQREAKEMVCPFLSGTMMGTGLMNFLLPIRTFNGLVLIIWWKGQEVMQNLKPVCGAS